MHRVHAFENSLKTCYFHEFNVGYSQAIADVIRTCLGPRAMLKMFMDPMGGIVMTNDGNAILREVRYCDSNSSCLALAIVDFFPKES